ncbi:MAG: HlyD family efflux transporter periplasmic adaptor subunit [Tunicatimonas sp.]
MVKKIAIALAVVAVLAGGYYFARNQGAEETNDITTRVRQDDLKINVTVSGELEAKNSVNVMGPTGLQSARIYQVKIDDIVPEGKVVQKGDFIAALDRSGLLEKIREEELDYEESLNKYEQTRIDTAIELRTQRDKLVNADYDVEEKRLILEQSEFEPPATIKQNELNLEKAKRTLSQGKQEYELLRQKSVSQMAQARAKFKDDQGDLAFLKNLSEQLTIKAPENGMVIYDRDWDGRKKEKGSQIQAWSPVVATLPDLTAMVSKTYVNEVDISRIKEGQKVELGLDAFPEKQLSGTVTHVANIGEQRPNSDAKVFEVTVEVHEADTTLRPAMTTSNMIVTDYVEEVLLVPLEAVHNQGDSLTYVFQKNGFATRKQEVALGPKGDDLVVVTEGLAENDVVYLSIPNNADEKPVSLLEKSQPLTVRGDD